VDVVVVLQEELLCVEPLVVLDAHGGRVVYHLVHVHVKQVWGGVEEPVTRVRNGQRHASGCYKRLPTALPCEQDKITRHESEREASRRRGEGEQGETRI
jgi:hypothetical protein